MSDFKRGLWFGLGAAIAMQLVRLAFRLAIPAGLGLLLWLEHLTK